MNCILPTKTPTMTFTRSERPGRNPPEPGDPGADNPVTAYVRKFAEVTGVDFFCGSTETTFAGVDERFSKIQARAHSSSSVLEDILKLRR